MRGFDLMLSCPEDDAQRHGVREQTFYDMIEIEVLDPDGHRICFGQDIVPR